MQNQTNVKMSKRKGLGAFVKAKSAETATTEAELVAKGSITAADVLALQAPCEGYLCKTTDNTFGLEFTAFKLRDMDSGHTLFEVAKPDDAEEEEDDEPEDPEDDSGRFVQYNFPPAFLQLKNLGATITFQTGDQPMKLRMVERHFFGNKLLKSFDFDFGFCIPKSTNTVEHIYEFPALSTAESDEMVSRPFDTKSDSFYFADDKLIMHNKSEYAYDAELA